MRLSTPEAAANYLSQPEATCQAGAGFWRIRQYPRYGADSEGNLPAPGPTWLGPLLDGEDGASTLGALHKLETSVAAKDGARASRRPSEYIWLEV